MTTTTGILRQSAEEILSDVETFYLGPGSPWIDGIQRSPSDPRLLEITMWDPDDVTEGEGDRVTYRVSAGRLKDAFLAAKKNGLALCCERDIADEQLGLGCAADLDIIIQMACYGRLVWG